MNVTDMPTEEILSEIERYQAIQKQVYSGSDLWEDCSMALDDLFAEMAKRQAH